MHNGKSMKKAYAKRMAAASLAVLLACPGLPAIRAQAAKASSKYVSMRTTFKTLQVGQKNRMTLKNNTVGWRITKVATNDRNIAMVYGKTEADFMVKGKSVGRTTIKARLKTAARKKFATKTVRCRVNVIAAEKPQETDENTTQAEVSTQAGLLKALANRNLKTLAIRTKDSEKFQIPAGTYTGVELTVDAPASDIENYGVFQSVTIHAIKSDTWVEKAVGNVMRVLAQAARIVVDKGARLSRMELAREDAKVNLEVNGKIDEVSVSAKMELSVSGKPEAPINLTIEESAAGTVLVSEATVNITAHASVDITLNVGAENSTVDIKSKDAAVKVNNYTNGTITVKNADGTIERKTSARITTSVIPYAPSYTGSTSTPNITTGPAVTPTGPAISGDDSDNDNSGSIGGGGSIGDIGGGIIGGEIREYPNGSYAAAMLQPKVLMTVTRAAIGTSSSISMAAILTFQLDPQKWEFSAPGHALWKCEAAGYPLLTDDTSEISIELDPKEYGDLADGREGIPYDLVFKYDDMDTVYSFSEDRYFVFYDKEVLDQYILLMEESGWTQMQLELPLVNCVYSFNTYYYGLDHIKSHQ